MVKAVVLGAAGGIGQVRRQTESISRPESSLTCITAIVIAPEDLSSRRRAFPV